MTATVVASGGAIDATILQAGDVLLYRPSSMFGKIISIKTWHRISHVEVCVGRDPLVYGPLGRWPIGDHAYEGCASVASRDGLGVNLYPVRMSGLAYVLRPNVPFNISAAMRWFNIVKGTPYGWVDLAAFVGLPWNSDGMFCSEFATQFLRCGAIRIFGDEPPRDVAPFEFRVADCLTLVWSDGQKD
jgi:hypothetical protein